jgi:hypothetical protein
MVRSSALSPLFKRSKIRNSRKITLEIHERAHVFAVEVPGSEVSLVPPRRYVLLRVQVADINIVEQQACRMLQEEPTF